MAIPVIVDCDPGHDDVFALWLTAGHPSLDLLAVTTVGGNVPLEHTSRNARVALTVAGVIGVPVAAGAAGPISRKLETAESIHGENGLGGPRLPEPAESLDPRSASELIADTVLGSTDPVAIIATGPITNVAIALRDRPEHRQPEPPGVVRMWVSRETGAPTRANAPGALFEAFLEHHAPQPGTIDYSDEGVDAETVEPSTSDDSLF